MRSFLQGDHPTEDVESGGGGRERGSLALSQRRVRVVFNPFEA